MFESSERKNCRTCGAGNLVESVYCCICSARFESIELSDADRSQVDLLVKKAVATGRPRGAIFPIEGKRCRITLPRGTYWPARLADPMFMTDPVSQTVRYENAALLVSSNELADYQAHLPAFEKCAREGRPIVVMAPSFSEEFLKVLLVNKLRGILRAAALVPEAGFLLKAVAGDLVRMKLFYASLFGAFAADESGPQDQAVLLELDNPSKVRLAVDLLIPKTDDL